MPIPHPLSLAGRRLRSLRRASKLAYPPATTAHLQASSAPHRHSLNTTQARPSASASPTFSTPPTSTQPLPDSHTPFNSAPLQTHSQLPASSRAGGPIDIYRSRVEAGILREDAHQLTIVNKLQDLYNRLSEYHPPTIQLSPPSAVGSSSEGWLNRLAGGIFNNRNPNSSPPNSNLNAPKGLYLYGSVGTGKSMLMDLFYDSLPSLGNVALPAQRIHFHQFMVEVHKRNHALQYPTDGTADHVQVDVLVSIARDLARESRILCFDEFQASDRSRESRCPRVTDIVDAMILKRLFETLIAYGVVCVMTSNRHPDELYKNGIQRASFVPCIELIKSQFLVTDLNSGTDYRKQPHALSKVYFSPLDQPNRAEFNKLFEALTDDDPVLPDRVLKIWGRTLKVPLSTGEVAWFNFQELCGNALSASDYLEIVKLIYILIKLPCSLSYKKLIKGDLLSSIDFTQARRFILFLDAAYESKTKLFTLSEIFSDGSEKSQKSISPEMRAAMDDLGLDLQTIGTSSLFSGEEETFAWARAVSRLSEMGTVNWSRQHRGPRIGASDLVIDPAASDHSSILLH
ncbi:hypothetical protein CROQUDRAFT_86235 [Cronartium quercuum f. sp. fusiforme G11]|uniref:AFG1-like ATPase n=1 Tax=Cronartium quercuum f. sp. fusiforme G11 TaxID=708437 RepID=A0A9P6TIQ0_9BASI|nr:hypothetical protein CROQUDRAFT_86235 [Cronartium quercuum f. sp. fusiforme G11]